MYNLKFGAVVQPEKMATSNLLWYLWGRYHDLHKFTMIYHNLQAAYVENYVTYLEHSGWSAKQRLLKHSPSSPPLSVCQA